ncbi:MAG TPA: alanine racemase [Candidatus Limnocylindrales bacterium]
MDWRTKGLWLPNETPIVGSNLFDGPFSWPVMVVKRGALAANIATMAGYCARHEVLLAPHGKTTMARSIVEAQLAAGAWGITVATPNQALIARKWGVPRVFMANELLDARVPRWAAEQDGFEFYSYLDSLDGVAVLAEAGVRASVFVEIGYPTGRTGCRTVKEAVEVADAARALPGVEVAGVSGFEGQLSTDGEVRSFLALIREASQAIGGRFVSAGGSSFFDIVIDELKGVAPQLILRSGCYVTHDHGTYAQTSPLTGTLKAALEVWAQVLSAPEPGFVVAGAGRRDLPHDSGLPIPLAVRGLDGSVRPANPGASVERLSDQHAHVNGLAARPGELVCFGISHPCTAFDKWRVIPEVDDGYAVVDLLETAF